ncbi:MAG: hypothetical protein ACHQWU_14820, partial [Gemmatimonadales bacterium]
LAVGPVLPASGCVRIGGSALQYAPGESLPHHGGRMSTHIKVLGWLHIIYGLFGLLGAIGVFAAATFGGLFSGNLGGMFGGILGGTIAAVVIGVMSLPGVIAGWGLLARRPWARIVIIILSILELIRFPLGTIVGVYGLWVLLSSEGAAQFQAEPGL